MNPANGKEAPLNVAGELWVSGRNVSNGYLNRPDLTEKHFVLDKKSGLRCYKTGDFAKVCMISMMSCVYEILNTLSQPFQINIHS